MGEGFPQYQVRPISGGQGRDFVRKHHYSRSCHNGPMCWGLLADGELIGVCAFATPSSENVRASVFGADYKDAVTELHRLIVLDGTPTNTESFFISRALQGLRERRPHIRGVLSFADETEGHVGTIYQATNALYCGKTKARARFWRDGEGRLRHPRQSGVNITPAMAAERGWTAEWRDTKHRYLFLLGSKTERRRWRRLLKLSPQPYPKV